MAFYRQNAGNIEPRNGTAPTRNAYPASIAVYGPAGLPPAMANAGTTQPSDGFRAYAGPRDPRRPVFGEHDGLRGRLMEVAQADMYFPLPLPFPRAGTWEEPGGPIAASRMIRLQPSSSAHAGLQMSTGPGPVMAFVAPPVFSVQTRPIYALGL